MNETLTAFLYLIASVCFIMSLRGLSSPETSRGGSRTASSSTSAASISR